VNSNEYHFVTRWKVTGTCEEVADILADPQDLVRWWPSVYLDVDVIQPGRTDGVGRVVAKRLAAEGANVLIHGRNQQRAEQVLREICGARVRPKKGMATFYQADFASLAEVRKLA